MSVPNFMLWIMICRYRRKRDKLVDRSAGARIPTMWGPFTAYCYRSILDGIEHIAMVKVSTADCLLFQNSEL